MNAAPFFKCYQSDFLNGIADMGPNEIAVYTVVIMRLYDEDGKILDDDQKIARRGNMRRPACRKAIDQLVSDGKLQRNEQHLTLPEGFMARVDTSRLAIPKNIRDAVMARDGNTCAYCGDTEGPFHLDHIHPVALGGQNTEENLTVACAPCNLSKGAKSLSGWLQ